MPKSYGTVEYSADKRAWKIVCEPHVSLRLKRVFGKLGKGSQGAHLISDNPENARDITWFLSRYPMIVKDPSRLSAQAQARRETLSLIDSILASDYVAPEFDLATPARDYQKRAAALWLARGGLLLADEVGLGKTASSICGLTDKRLLPALVVTLTHLPRQWRSELTKFAPDLFTHIVKTGKPYDMTGNRTQPNLLRKFPDVVIINYHKLAGWAETLVAAGIRSVIFDEVQELRKGAQVAEEKRTGKYRAAELICNHVDFRIGLSATPIFNYGVEFYSVVNCLCPGELGTTAEFALEWCRGGFTDKTTIKQPKAFGSYLRESGIMLRRTASEVGRELPKAQVTMQWVDADESALNTVSDSCAELARLILSDIPESQRGSKMQASEEFSNRLRQATGIAKAPFVAEFVRLLLESGEKVVLYGWHRAVYSIWLDKLSDFKPAFYTGHESVPQKEEAKRRFIKHETNLMIISLRSGQGLDGLQHVCRIVVFGELDYSPAVHHQDVGRVLRDGQKESVLAYYLVSDEGSDPTISEILGIKQQQHDGVVHDVNEDELIQALQTDGGHVKRLAEAYLVRKSKEVAA